MLISKKIKPGQPGTKRLVRQYGENLLSVRYRYDAVRRKRIKTVEIIVEEREWLPRRRPEKMVAVRIDDGDQVSKRRIMAVRGVWNGNAKVWALPYAKVQALGLEDKIEIMKVSKLGKVEVSNNGNF